MIITKRNGNGQTECYGCKQKGKFSLTWDCWLYNYNNKPYCYNCLMEELEQLNKEKQELIDYLKEKINKIKEEIEHYDLWHEVGTDINFLILRKQMFKEILDKIEKSDK